MSQLKASAADSAAEPAPAAVSAPGLDPSAATPRGYTRDAIDHAESDTDDDMTALEPLTEEDKRKDAEEVSRQFTPEQLRMIAEEGHSIMRSTEDTPNGILVYHWVKSRAQSARM